MTVRVLSGFNTDAWRGQTARSALHDVDWLTAMASRLPGNVQTVVSEGGVAFVGVVVADLDAYEAYNPEAILWRNPPVFEVTDPPARAAALIRSGHDRPSTLPALVLVAPGYGGDPAGREAGDASAVTACLRDLLAWCAGASLAGLHVLYTRSDAVQEAVRNIGGCSYRLTTRSVLPVWWSDWSTYLAGLSGKRRRGVQREFRQASSAMTLGEVAPADHADDILEGRCALLARYAQHADALAERRRLTTLIEVFGARLRVFGGLRDGRLVAGCLCLRAGRTLRTLYTTVTETGQNIPFAHFAATFYSIIQGVSGQDFDEVDYGIGHRTGKEMRGCKTEHLYGHSIGMTPEAQAWLNAAASLLA